MPNTLSDFDSTSQLNFPSGLPEQRLMESLIHEQEHEVNRLKGKLDDFHNYLEGFIHAAAHDLQSPVANLKLLSKLMDRSEEPKEFLLETINSSVLKLEHTIKSLVEAIGLQCSEELPVSLSVEESFVNTVTPFFQDLKAVNGAMILSIEPGLRVYYVEYYFNFLIRNLFLNSLTYRSAERDLQIKIDIYQEKDFTLIRFEDNGIGIDLKKYGHNLFKPFTRFSSIKTGRGLALHLIKSMVEKYGGFVELESELGVGTQVRCYLKKIEDRR